jgi:hypothetical protein
MLKDRGAKTMEFSSGEEGLLRMMQDEGWQRVKGLTFELMVILNNLVEESKKREKEITREAAYRRMETAMSRVWTVINGGQVDVEEDVEEKAAGA